MIHSNTIDSRIIELSIYTECEALSKWHKFGLNFSTMAQNSESEKERE